MTATRKGAAVHWRHRPSEVTARPPGGSQWAVSAVLALAAVGVILAAFVAWRAGTVVLALALLLAAALRLSLPPSSVGWLVVRGRAFDAAVLLVLGFAMVALALSIPGS